jgi:hypothetical protein
MGKRKLNLIILIKYFDCEYKKILLSVSYCITGYWELISRLKIDNINIISKQLFIQSLNIKIINLIYKMILKLSIIYYILNKINKNNYNIM